MKLKICQDNSSGSLGVSAGIITIVLKSGKITESHLDNCKDSPFDIKDEYLTYKDLKIPLIYKDERIKLARILFILLGKTRHEIFYYKNTQIFIDIPILNLKFDNLEESYTKICGNYGSTKLIYCIANKDIAIMSPNKEEAHKALFYLKELINLLSVVNNFV